MSTDDEQAWDLLVESALPVVFGTMQYWGLSGEDMSSVCDVVFLRLLNMVSGPDRAAPERSSVTGAIRTITIEECERARRLNAWRRPEVDRVVDLTEERQNLRGGLL